MGFTGSNARSPTRYVCDQKPLLVKDIGANLKKTDWQTIEHRTSTKGAMVRKAALLEVYVWSPDKEKEMETVQLLINTEEDGSEIKYSLCYGGKVGKMFLKTPSAKGKSLVVGNVMEEK